MCFRGHEGPGIESVDVQSSEGMTMTKFTEAPLVIGALHSALLWVGVQAFIPRRAIAVLCIPPTLGHASEIVLMKELACVPLLAQTAQPVLTYGRETLTLTRMGGELLRGLEVLNGGGRMSEVTMQGAEGAASWCEG